MSMILFFCEGAGMAKEKTETIPDESKQSRKKLVDGKDY